MPDQGSSTTPRTRTPATPAPGGCQGSHYHEGAWKSFARRQSNMMYHRSSGRYGSGRRDACRGCVACPPSPSARASSPAELLWAAAASSACARAAYAPAATCAHNKVVRSAFWNFVPKSASLKSSNLRNVGAHRKCLDSISTTARSTNRPAIDQLVFDRDREGWGGVKGGGMGVIEERVGDTHTYTHTDKHTHSVNARPVSEHDPLEQAERRRPK